MASFNSGGNHLLCSALLRNDTGIEITVAAAATPQALLGTAFASDEDDDSGGITWTPASGVFTVAAACGIGRYLARACLTDVKGTDAKYFFARIFAKEGGVAAAVRGPQLKRTEPATAVHAPLGVVEAIVDLSAVGDTVELRLGVETNGNDVTVKDCSFVLIKVGEID